MPLGGKLTLPRADSAQCIASRSTGPSRSSSLTCLLCCLGSPTLQAHGRHASNGPCRLVLLDFNEHCLELRMCLRHATFNKACNFGVTCIVSYWENTVNSPIFQVPPCSAFSSSRMQLSIFSNSSRQRPQLAMGIQVLGLPGCHCKSKVAMLHGWILWSPFVAQP